MPITASSSSSSILVYKSIRLHRRGSSFSLHNSRGKVVASVDGDHFSNVVMRMIKIQLLREKGNELKKAEMKRKALMSRTCLFEFRAEEYKWRYARAVE
jgi:hypothetical protein